MTELSFTNHSLLKKHNSFIISRILTNTSHNLLRSKTVNAIIAVAAFLFCEIPSPPRMPPKRKRAAQLKSSNDEGNKRQATIDDNATKAEDIQCPNPDCAKQFRALGHLMSHLEQRRGSCKPFILEKPLSHDNDQDDPQKKSSLSKTIQKMDELISLRGPVHCPNPQCKAPFKSTG